MRRRKRHQKDSRDGSNCLRSPDQRSDLQTSVISVFLQITESFSSFLPSGAVEPPPPGPGPGPGPPLIDSAVGGSRRKEESLHFHDCETREGCCSYVSPEVADVGRRSQTSAAAWAQEPHQAAELRTSGQPGGAGQGPTARTSTLDLHTSVWGLQSGRNSRLTETLLLGSGSTCR